MNMELMKSEYCLLDGLITDWVDDSSLIGNLHSLRGRSKALDEIIDLRFSGDLMLLISFVLANSSIVYDVEVIQDTVETAKYFRYFNTPVTEADVAKEFDKDPSSFMVCDRWTADSWRPDYFIEVKRMMDPFEELKYQNFVKDQDAPFAVASVVTFEHAANCAVTGNTFTANVASSII